jgi:DNA gyrase subunit A
MTDKNQENHIGKINSRQITNEMEESYLSYAMSVIVSRALPDVRDGLKPVQRRILFSMWQLGLKHNARYRKSATVVGEVLGKWHPHGDSAVYETMVRMAQDFSLRYPLVDGQGNFGSIDGDSAAAMRYTEAKMAGIAEELLLDLEKDTVAWRDNYDSTRKEPAFLPAKLPQLLLNGTMGIAVGMATNIPPHNLIELVDGISYLVDNPDATIEDLTKFIQGPDFPTGGIIYNKNDILNAYTTGRGGITTRAKAEIIETDRGKFSIIISELTYQTNKAVLIQRMAELVKTGKLIGIRDIRDESDREGIRVVIDLKKDAYPNKILNQLYKLTDLQKNFNLNMLALVDGIEPQTLNLKSILEHYVDHRKSMVTRRIQFDLRKAEARAHILEGLKKALDHINEVIETIKKSPNKEDAHKNLMSKFKLSDLQATAILEMKLQVLAGLERKKIEDELKEKLDLIKEYQAILGDPKKILEIIKEELKELKTKYNEKRRTRVIKSKIDDLSQEDLIANEESIISLTGDGYIKRLQTNTFRAQKRGGKGVRSGNMKEDDVIDRVLSVMSHDNVLFFTDTGKVFQTKAYEIPISSRTSKGNAIVNFLQISPEERITSIKAVSKDSEAKYLVMQTVKGKIKKVRLEDFQNVRRNGLIAIKLNQGDSLGWVDTSNGKNEIMLITNNGQSIKFDEKNVRPMGRVAGGVLGIRLKKEDKVVGMHVVHKEVEGAKILVISEKGYGKKTLLKKYKTQSRNGSGIKTAKITARTGKIVSSHIIEEEDEKGDLLASSNKGQVIRTAIKSISELGRSTQGVRVMRLREGEKIAATTIL